MKKENSLKIYVDADACSVVYIVEQVAQKKRDKGDIL